MISYIYKFFQYIITEHLSEVKYVNLYNDQFNNSLKASDFNYPAILIEFQTLNEFEQYAQRIQMMDMNVILHVGTEFYSGLRRGDSQQDEALEHLDIVDSVFKAFEQKNSTNLPDTLVDSRFYIGNIHRFNFEMLSDYDAVKVTKNNFRFRFLDMSAMPIYTNETIGCELNIGYTTEQAKVINLIT